MERTPQLVWPPQDRDTYVPIGPNVIPRVTTYPSMSYRITADGGLERDERWGHPAVPRAPDDAGYVRPIPPAALANLYQTAVDAESKSLRAVEGRE